MAHLLWKRPYNFTSGTKLFKFRQSQLQRKPTKMKQPFISSDLKWNQVIDFLATFNFSFIEVEEALKRSKRIKVKLKSLVIARRASSFDLLPPDTPAPAAHAVHTAPTATCFHSCLSCDSRHCCWIALPKDNKMSTKFGLMIHSTLLILWWLHDGDDQKWLCKTGATVPGAAI